MSTLVAKHFEVACRVTIADLSVARCLQRLRLTPFTLLQEDLFSAGEVIRVQAHHPVWVKNARRGQHSHDFYELVYVHSGGFSQVLEGIHVGQTSRELVLIRPGAQHATWSRSPGDVVFNILLDRRFVEEEISQIVALSGEMRTMIEGGGEAGTPGTLRIPCSPELSAVVGKLIAEYFDYAGRRERRLGGLVALLFSGMSGAGQILPSREEILVTDVLRHVNERYREVSGDSLARQFGYSARHLSRLLATHAGATLTSLVNAERIERVGRGLLRDEAPVSVLAQDAGFTDMNYFYQVFNRELGISLRQFRDLLDSGEV